MSQPVIQTSFNSGEWAPALYARVDLTKYHSGAALLRNFFVDYRGGATTRPGSKYVLKAFKSSTTVRLIPFQASFTVAYILEFGDGYIRFYNNGAPVLEAATTISGVTQANPGVVTDTAHGYVNGQWIFISGVGGMTQLNGNFYQVLNVTANTYTLTDLVGNAINTTTFGAYTSGGTAQRVYTIASPFQAADLKQIKYVQNVNQLILCHPNYPPQVLTLNTATNWTIAAISFGPTLAAPTSGTITSTSGAGSQNAQYVVTAVDANGQESNPSGTIAAASITFAGNTNTIGWAAVTGAVSYNVYRTIISQTATIPGGVPFGYLGSATGTKFLDTNISPNFSIVAPTPENPFFGSGVATVNVTASGSGYTTVPSVSFSGGGGSGATAAAVMTVISTGTFSSGTGWNVGDTASDNFGAGSVMKVTAADPRGTITGFVLVNTGQVSGGSLPGSLSYGGGTRSLVINVSWGVQSIGVTSPGTGYTTPPTVNISGGGGATATAALGAASAGNPSVPGFFQQRLFLGGPVLSPSQFNMSQPGAPFNFNVTFPVQATNAIQQTLSNTVLNSIKSTVPVSAGLIVFSDKGAWLLNGGSPGSPISALALVANPQAYSGASDLQPIATPNDLLYVQSKNSIVRDLAFNFYLNNYVGTDISILSSHLFYGFQLNEWCFAEEPFKLVWAVRNDGTLLTLTFVKEQELVAWAHSDTQGSYRSIASIIESTAVGNVDAVYTVVQRTINNVTVQYIERFVELNYPNDYKSSWQVDAGIGYNGAAATTFSGAQHLAGTAVTGIADGVVINFTMPTSGTFVFGPGGTAGLTGIANASIVTVGLAFTPQLTTLPLDLGEPTVSGKRKKVTGLSMKVQNTLGLSAGRTIGTAVALNDTTLNAIGTMSNTQVTGLVTGDVRLIVDPVWDVYGQYSITQPNPYPASILGVVPEIEVGDDK